MAVRHQVTRGAPTALQLSTVVLTDENYTVVDDDCFINLKTTGAGSRTLTFPTTAVQGSGRLVFVQMTAQSTGTYATSGVLGGEVTFDVDETSCLFVSEDGVGWHALRLTDASIAASEVVTGDIADAAVTPVKLGGTVVTTANDGTPAITAALSVLEFQKTANTTTAITMTGTHAGHQVVLKMLVGDADSVYTAAVAGGTITFNAAEEAAGVYYDGTEWRHSWLTGATFA